MYVFKKQKEGIKKLLYYENDKTFKARTDKKIRSLTKYRKKMEKRRKNTHKARFLAQVQKYLEQVKKLKKLIVKFVQLKKRESEKKEK